MHKSYKSLLASERLYAITDCTQSSHEKILGTTRSLFEAGVNLLQYRNKNKHSDYKLLASRLQELCRQYDAIFIINDDIDLTIELDADGIHLGENDTSLKQARIQLPNKLIGISCYNDFKQALQAEQNGADYVAFGSFFPSVTKPNARSANTELLTRGRKELNIPVIAIGGITPQNAEPLIHAGADYLAVISALYDCPDPYQQAQNYLSLFKR